MDAPGAPIVDPDSLGRLDPEVVAFITLLQARIEHWPLPLAYPAAQCIRWCQAPASLVGWQCKLFEQTLRLTSLYLTGAYLAGSITRTDINTALTDDLRRPVLGKWRGFLRDTLDRLVTAGLDVPLVRAIHAFHAAVGVQRDVPGPPVLRDAHIVQGRSTVIDAILEIRNDLQHGSRALDDELADLTATSLAGLLQRVTTALDVLLDFQLVARSSAGQTIRLHGPTPPQSVEDHACLLIDPEGTSLSLYPLALVDLLGETLRRPNDPPVDLLLYDGRQEKRLRLIGLTDSQERKDAYVAFSQLLQRKSDSALQEDPVATWDRKRLHEALAMRQLQLEADGRAPAPSELSVPRPDIEGRLEEFLLGPSSAVLLTGAPGAGRSALLGRMVHGLLGRGIPALGLSASIVAPLLAYGGLAEVLPEVLIARGSLDELIAAATRPIGRPGLVLAFDALEGAGSIDLQRRFLAEVEQLTRRYPASSLKVVLAVQSQALARALDGTAPLDERTWFHSVLPGPEGDLLSMPEVPVEELTLAQAELLYESLRQAAGSNAPETPWAFLPAGVQARLRLPAFAQRLVTFVHAQPIRHEDVVVAADRAYLERALYGRRLDYRRRVYTDAFPGRRLVVTQIALTMLEQGRTEVPVAGLDGEGDDYREVLGCGVLHEVFLPGEPNTLHVRFATPAFFAVVAADLLLANAALRDRLLFSADLSLLCRRIPGLESALVELLRLDLEGTGELVGRLDLERSSGARFRAVAAALLRVAEAGPDPALRALQSALGQRPSDVREALITQALDEDGSYSRPEAAALVAKLALEHLAVARGRTLLSLSRALRRAGQMDLAARALQVVPVDAAPASEAQRLYCLGSLLRDQGRWQDALDILRRAGDGYRAIGDVDGVLKSLASLAEALSLLNRFDEAAEVLDRAEEEGRGASLETELRFRVKHALSLRMRGLLRKAYHRCEDVVARASTAALLPLLARAETELGIIHALLDDPSGGIPHLEKALIIKRQLGDSRGLKQVYFSLGFAHSVAGNLEAAREAYERSRFLNQETNDVYGELLCLEFLLRLRPELVEKPDLLRAVELGHRAASWKNPRIQAILQEINRRLQVEECEHGPV